MTTVDLFKVEAAIEEVRQSLIEFADRFAEIKDDYSPEGQKKTWQKATTPHTLRVSEIHAILNEVENYGKNLTEAADADLFPTADPADAAAVTAAELTAARYLARGASVELINEIAGWDPSPARTIIAEEVLHRDVLSEDHLVRTFRGRDADNTTTHAEAGAVAQVVGILRDNLRRVEERLSSWNARVFEPESDHRLTVSMILSEATVEIATPLTQWQRPKKHLILFHSPSAAESA